MPGSPPSSVTEPGTSPPCSTRSSSPIEVGSGGPGLGVDLGDRHRHARRSTSAPAAALAATGCSISSTSVFHASQAPQRPAHFGSAAPQSVHRYTVLVLAITRTYVRPVTAARIPSARGVP